MVSLRIDLFVHACYDRVVFEKQVNYIYYALLDMCNMYQYFKQASYYQVNFRFKRWIVLYEYWCARYPVNISGNTCCKPNQLTKSTSTQNLINPEFIIILSIFFIKSPKKINPNWIKLKIINTFQIWNLYHYY